MGAVGSTARGVGRFIRRACEGSPSRGSARLPVERRRSPPQPVGDHDLAVARQRLDVLPHPPVEVVLVQLCSDDGLVHLAQLSQGEGFRQETVGIGVDVDVAVADLVALRRDVDRSGNDLVVVEEETGLSQAAVGTHATRSPSGVEHRSPAVRGNARLRSPSCGRRGRDRRRAATAEVGCAPMARCPPCAEGRRRPSGRPSAAPG